MAFHLSEAEIRQRLVEWRNLKMMHGQARQRVAKLLLEIKQFKVDKIRLKQLIRAKDKTINGLRDQLADKEAQRKELLGYLYQETALLHDSSHEQQWPLSPGISGSHGVTIRHTELEHAIQDTESKFQFSTLAWVLTR